MDLLIGQGFSYEDSVKIPSNILETAKIKSGFKRSEYELSMALYNYNATILITPVSGTVANIFDKVNTYPSTSSTFCTILDLNAMEILFPVMENELHLLSMGQKIQMCPYFNEAQMVDGYITSINPVINENGLAEIRAKAKNNDNGLLEGMNMKVFIKKPVGECLVIPKKAITLRTERKVVFTYKKGFAKWNYIKIDYENSSQVSILEDEDNTLKIGDSIIVEGNVHLAHDSRVVIGNVNNE